MSTLAKPLATTRHEDIFHVFGPRTIPFSEVYDLTGVGASNSFTVTGSRLLKSSNLPVFDRYKGMRFELVYTTVSILGNIIFDLSLSIGQYISTGPLVSFLTPAPVVRSITATGPLTLTHGFRRYIGEPVYFVNHPVGFNPVSVLSRIMMTVTFTVPGGTFNFIGLNIEIL